MVKAHSPIAECRKTSPLSRKKVLIDQEDAPVIPQDCVSPKMWKTWLGLSGSTDEMDEPTKFPFYFVVVNFVIHFGILVGVFAPFFDSGHGLLWDKSGWLLTNFVVTAFSWFFFYKTVTTKPGYLDDSLPDIGKWRRLYEETLASYADESAHENAPYVSAFV